MKQQQEVHDQLKLDFDDAKETLNDLIRQLPSPDMSNEHRTQLKEVLEKLGHHVVSITYLDVPDSRPGAFAGVLQTIFRSASWKVDLRGDKWNRRDKKGLNMRVDDAYHLPPTQQAVMKALVDVGYPPSFLVGFDVEDRIELIVGAM